MRDERKPITIRFMSDKDVELFTPIEVWASPGDRIDLTFYAEVPLLLEKTFKEVRGESISSAPSLDSI